MCIRDSLYECQSSRLTNQHVHGLIKHSLFGYNDKQSFGRVDFDLTAADPTVKYTVVNSTVKPFTPSSSSAANSSSTKPFNTNSPFQS